MKPILPGSTIGIIGGGQLARMMALEARRMGYRIAVLDPDRSGSAAQVADVFVEGAWDDRRAAEDLAAQSDVITIDTEHVPADLLEWLEQSKPVRPGASILRIVQDRAEQRHFLETLGAPQPKNAVVSDDDSLRAAAQRVGFPCVLKTRRSGYDGKGQATVGRLQELRDAWSALGHRPAVLEEYVAFDKEISILLARNSVGDVRFYSVAENVHRRHVLHTTRAPARISAEQAKDAEKLGARIAEALGHIGMMAVELFVTREGSLLVNEIAPRTHNSGHHTFGASATSQFEQHIRAICGLALGEPTQLRPAVMLNLFGDLWREGPPDWHVVLKYPTAHLHLYGKKPEPGRKMGHVLILDNGNESNAFEIATALATELERGT